MKFKYVLLKNHRANFNQTGHKASLDEGDSPEVLCPFQRGDNKQIAKIHWATPICNLVLWIFKQKK